MEPTGLAYRIAVRPFVGDDQTAVLTAILSATDYGVMLTDLDHTTIACNRRFGEIFDVDIERVVHSDSREVRRMVQRLIPDMGEWERNLEQVYVDPMRTQEDEIVLNHARPMAVRRYTGPVLDKAGNVIGRLWTFLDVSQESRRRRIGAELYDVSTLHDDDPSRVYSAIVERVSKYYGTNAFLSILKEDYLEFRAVSSPLPQVEQVPGNFMKDSYCQFAVLSKRPVVIQDARERPEYSGLLPCTVGFTRYLGVPLSSPDGALIGTLCLLDGQSEVELDDQDVHFMTLLAMRVNAELAREHSMKERIAEKQRVVEAQENDLAVTRAVLSTINRGFGLLGRELDQDALLSEQAALLRGILGYKEAGLLIGVHGSEAIEGYAARSGKKRPERVRLQGRIDLRSVLTDASCHVIPLRNVPGHDVFLLLGSPKVALQRTAFHEAHLEALAEQVSLVLASHVLQGELGKTYQELRDTHERLVQSEKLSVVGTLAASTAHDIKNILSSITLELGFGVDDPARALTSVKGHLDRFSVLAHRLLSYAKPRLVAMRPVDVDDVLQRVLVLTATFTRISDVTVVWSKDDALPTVQGDPNQLEHLFVNLVMNAVQAMQEAGGTLTVTTEAKDGCVVIEVKDSGKGMPTEVMDHLFEPFTSTRTEGFGLGLFSCRRIVEGHGGDIAVRSVPGQETVFTVTLKASRAS